MRKLAGNIPYLPLRGVHVDMRLIGDNFLLLAGVLQKKENVADLADKSD